MEREKEIRADMKQLAASEARVAALEQQLQDQAQLRNPRGNTLSRREKAYFSDLTTQSQARPWFPSPIRSRVLLVPVGVQGRDWYDFAVTPSSPFDDTSYMAVNVSHGVSTDTATVSIVRARSSIPTFGGPQQSLECALCNCPLLFRPQR